MKDVPAIAAGLILAMLQLTLDWAIAGGDLGKFPESYAQGVHYATVERGWHADYPPAKRNGEWDFQAFHADKTVNRNEALDRCFACHKSKAADDFVFTRDHMKSAP